METLASGYGLLEGPVWDQDRGLIFADTANGGVYLHRPNGQVATVARHRRGIGGIVRHRAGGLIVSGRNVAYKGGLGDETTVLIERDGPGGLVGFNDMAADDAGRVYVGVLGFRPTATELSGIGGDGKPAPLMLIELDGTTRVVQNGVKLSNGLSFSPDGNTLYHADSGDQTVYRYDVDPEGSLHDKRPFARVADGLPDGLATSADGDIWVAVAHGGRVLRLSSTGTVRQEISFPVPMVTSLCFGGTDMKEVFVVSGSDGTGRADAGSIFRFRSDVPGTPVGIADVTLGKSS